jgi:predicted enzyme related to lactoylglutathione lyase
MVLRFGGATLWTEDLQRLLPFYRDIIGLPVALDSPGFVILGSLDAPSLCIGTHSEVRGRSTDRHRWLVRFDTGDIHAEVDRLAAHGIPIYQEPEHQGGGFWIATCEDPDGNFVQLTCMTKEQTP